ncbi:MAG: phytanoyl-CoA dioxygenase family protein, partial [Myxococcota bacterium]
MSIDCRTRFHRDRRTLSRDEVFDDLFPEAIERNAVLAARGLLYKGLPSLGLTVEGKTLTLKEQNGHLELEEGAFDHGAVAELGADALSDLVQDWKTTMGLAMNSQVDLIQGEFSDWVGWEPIFRALFDGRPVHEAGAIDFKNLDGSALDLSRSFDLDDDREEIAHFLHEAGFLHVRNVFTEEEMTAVSADLDVALSRAELDDGASWWAGDSTGAKQPVRVLFFHERSEALRTLLHDDRLQWIGQLTGDDHNGAVMGAEGLVKPLDIQTGLSDLPWHKDCGQGGHSYFCNGLTVGISVTGADSHSGALGVVPGSHRANVQTAGKDESLDMASIKLETETGDLTVHC